MGNEIPDFVKKYLWGVSSKTLSTQKHAIFIIERILEYGDFDSVFWIDKTYGKQKVAETLKTSVRISPKSANLYSLYYNIPKSEIAC